MKFGTIIVYGDRCEFRDGAPTADGVLLQLLNELAMMYDAMDSRAKQVHFRGSRLQTGGSCFVVVKLASLVVSCWGNRAPMPPINVLIGRPHEQHDSCTRVSCPHYLRLSALSGADGVA